MKRIVFFILLSLTKLIGYAQMPVDANFPHRDDWGQWRVLYSEGSVSVLYRLKLCGFMDKVKKCSLHNAECEFKLTGAKLLTGIVAYEAEKTKCNGSDGLEPVKLSDKLVFTEQRPNIHTSHSFVKVWSIKLKDVKK